MTYSNFSRPVAAKEVFAVPQNTRVEQSVVYSCTELGVTEVWPGPVSQQVLDNLETAVLAGICSAGYHGEIFLNGMEVAYTSVECDPWYLGGQQIPDLEKVPRGFAQL